MTNSLRSVIETLDFPCCRHKPRPILEIFWLPQCGAGTLVLLAHTSSRARPQGSEQQTNCSSFHCCLSKDTQRDSSHWRWGRILPAGQALASMQRLMAFLLKKWQQLARCLWKVERAAANSKPSKVISCSPRRYPMWHRRSLPSGVAQEYGSHRQDPFSSSLCCDFLQRDTGPRFAGISQGRGYGWWWKDISSSKSSRPHQVWPPNQQFPYILFLTIPVFSMYIHKMNLLLSAQLFKLLEPDRFNCKAS